jgi:hypothetical protein
MLSGKKSPLEIRYKKSPLELQESLKEGKGLGLYDKDELEYITKPMGSAIYVSTIKSKDSKVGRKKIKESKKAKPTDRIKCDICPGEYSRSSSTNHKRTKIHQAFLKINKNLKEIIVK